MTISWPVSTAGGAGWQAQVQDLAQFWNQENLNLEHCSDSSHVCRNYDRSVTAVQDKAFLTGAGERFHVQLLLCKAIGASLEHSGSAAKSILDMFGLSHLSHL